MGDPHPHGPPATPLCVPVSLPISWSCLRDTSTKGLTWVKIVQAYAYNERSHSKPRVQEVSSDTAPSYGDGWSVKPTISRQSIRARSNTSNTPSRLPRSSGLTFAYHIMVYLEADYWRYFLSARCCALYKYRNFSNQPTFTTPKQHTNIRRIQHMQFNKYYRKYNK